MFKILIIEDEAPARKKMIKYLEQACSSFTLLAEIDTVEQATEYLQMHQDVDLIISDIELRDGNAFEIFDVITPSCPIIFTTAYDEFLMNAFETSGIAYLLKPYSADKFMKAWDKFIQLKGHQKTQYADFLNTINRMFVGNDTLSKIYKEQFSIRAAQEIYFIKTEDIVYFQANEGVVFAYDKWNKKHIMPQATLKEIEEHLNPKNFFRINRSETLQRQYIHKIERFSKNAVAVYLNNNKAVLKTSQNRTGEFNSWLE